jgi:hypothetical protein
MPVILNAGSEAMKTWLDPGRKTWSKDLQSLLKPYEGELECYQVPKEVGKVGNNSPDFIVPVDSKENKNNIANFFANAQKIDEKPLVTETSPKKEPASPKTEATLENDQEKILTTPGVKRQHTPDSSTKDIKKVKKLPAPVTPQKMKTRSATSNISNKKPGAKKSTDGSQRITNFFK